MARRRTQEQEREYIRQYFDLSIPEPDTSHNAIELALELVKHGHDGRCRLFHTLNSENLLFVMPESGNNGKWYRVVQTHDQRATLWVRTNGATVQTYIQRLKDTIESAYSLLLHEARKAHDEREERNASEAREDGKKYRKEKFDLPDSLVYISKASNKSGKTTLASIEDSDTKHAVASLLEAYNALSTPSQRKLIENDMHSERFFGITEEQAEFDQWTECVPCLSGFCEYSEDQKRIITTPITAEDRLTWLIPQTFSNEVSTQAQVCSLFQKTFFEVHGDVNPSSAYGEALQIIYSAPLYRNPAKFEYFVNVFGRTGSNGKTLIREAIEHALGDKATRQIPENLLITSQKQRDYIRSGSSPTMDTETLAGACYGFNTEAPENARLNESMVKTISSGERFASRKHHGAFRNLSATPILFLYGNYPLKMNLASGSIDRRHIAIVYPFTYMSKDRQKARGLLHDSDVREMDTTLKQRLQRDGKGIFAFLLKGLELLHEKGYEIPKDLPEFHEAEKQAKARMYPLEMHFAECYEACNDYELTGDQCMRVYKMYCDLNGFQSHIPKRFTDQVKKNTEWAYREDSTKRTIFLHKKPKQKFMVAIEQVQHGVDLSNNDPIF